MEKDTELPQQQDVVADEQGTGVEPGKPGSARQRQKTRLYQSQEEETREKEQRKKEKEDKEQEQREVGPFRFSAGARDPQLEGGSPYWGSQKSRTAKNSLARQPNVATTTTTSLGT